ncbi:MAG: exonuclease SbcCD subunit D [Treponema sp.]|jgi:exonuclease SbcD|nr:exonuclease SbcCD subunit D [Treponema sp.]
MKFLHTADLHLGKVFHDHSLEEDQRRMLDELVDIMAAPSYQALLIAGDVYDRSIPPPEAVSLLSAFLGKLKARRPELAVLILPGNHDSASRLGFGRELFRELGIYFVTRPEDAFEPVLLPVTGDGAGAACAFFLLPFLSAGSLRGEYTGLGAAEPLAGSFSLPTGTPSLPVEPPPLHAQGRLAEEAAARLELARQRVLAKGAVYTVLGAHLFAAGGLESESERVFLGQTERVPISLFQGFDYVGLGHLHRFQQAGGNAWYSGSPLAYSFGEAEAYSFGEASSAGAAGSGKAFLSVELGPGAGPGEAAVRVEPIPVRPLRRLWRLQGSFDHFFNQAEADPALQELREDYLEIVLTDGGLVENPLALLRSRFPWLLSVRQERAFAAMQAHGALRQDGAAGGERRSLAEDFEDFLAEIYGRVDADEARLFRELAALAEAGAGEGGEAV